MLNNISLMGRLTRDPETRVVGSKGITVTQFKVAVDRDFQKEGAEKQTDFITCRAWRQTADFIDRYFRKGMLVALQGSLQSSKWTDRDGQDRTNWFVNVSQAHFAEPKKDGAGGKPYAGYAREEMRRPPDISAPDFEELPDDGELPF